MICVMPGATLRYVRVVDAVFTSLTILQIASLDFWRSDAYRAYFDFLDQAGGFFYERWGTSFSSCPSHG